jgi:aquaporin related protein
VGPILGSLLASGFYKLIKMLEYETANPGQDSSKVEGEHFNPDLENAHNPRVSFAPEDYARTGTPKDYGYESKLFNDSPFPPHPNNKFSSVQEGGIPGNGHGNDSSVRGSGGSKDTLGPVGMNEYHHDNNVVDSNLTPPYPPTTTRSAMKASTSNGPIAVKGTQFSAKINTYHNQNISSGTPYDDEFYEKL